MSQSLRQASSKGTWMSVVLASPPVVLLILLAIINPVYLASFFDAGTTYGLALVGAIAVPTVGAYPAMLASARVFASGKRGVGIGLGVLTLLLCVLPAMILILLAPASAAIASLYVATPVP